VWTTAAALIDNMAGVQELRGLICKAQVPAALVLVLLAHLLLLALALSARLAVAK
jgi:hypothetical protein